MQLCTQDPDSEKTIWSKSTRTPTFSKYFAELSYREGLKIQENWYQRVRSHELSAVCLGFTHPPTITLGKRSSFQEDLLFGRPESSDIEIVEVDRGGHATLHSPGQLVLYPVVDLRFFRLGVLSFVTLLQEAVANVLRRLGVCVRWDSTRPGLYTSTGKIAFFGIRVSRGVSTHGLSINVSNNLDLFTHIRSCGVSGERFDCLSRHVDINEQELFDLVAKEIGEALRVKSSG